MLPRVLALASIAMSAVFASAQPIASNESAPISNFVAPNSSSSGFARVACIPPANSFGRWYYNNRDDGPYYCYGTYESAWAMLNSYRAGGTENVHWKYTNDNNDLECLYYWKWYAEDGKTLISKIQGGLVQAGSARTWCALPVYRSGGVQGKQWDYCSC